MNKLIISIIVLSLSLCYKSNAQEERNNVQGLVLGKGKAHKKTIPDVLPKAPSRSNPVFAKAVFISDLEGSIWINEKKYLLEAGKATLEIPVTESFNYYFLTKDEKFSTEDKLEGIKPHLKDSILTYNIRPKEKFDAYLKAEKEQRISEQFFKTIENQLIDIGHGVSMSKYEVTVKQYAQFIKETGATKDKFTDNFSLIIVYKNSIKGIRSKVPNIDWRYNPMGKLIDLENEEETAHPVLNVSWHEAKAFCEWLSSKSPEYHYRLPFVNEWESVAELCSDLSLSAQANFADASLQKQLSNKKVNENEDDGFAFSSPVGALQANENGFYDLLGNVAEWMEDDLKNNKEYYKVIKGGSYFIQLTPNLIHKKKNGCFSGTRHSAIGFRICREPKRGL